jgi:eukaryotic-like serine/threonine-protein kinase
MIGKNIFHYRVLEKLGGGGMGVVYKAEDIKLGRLAALKFLSESLSRDKQALERFQREAQAASALNHPNICTIYGIDEFQGHHFIAMELLEGRTLGDLIGHSPLPVDRILDLSIQISEALDAAHSKGIIHRDIKPANIFVTKLGLAKVLDFGIAKLAPNHAEFAMTEATQEADEALTTPGSAIGTIAYMSPEQARGEELDPRSDLFSLGAVIYMMATGKEAFTRTSTALIYDAILNRVPTAPTALNPKILPDLERIIGKTLERDVALRYQSASDLRADLQRLKRDSNITKVAASTGSTWSAPTVTPTLPGTAPGRKWIWAAAAGVVLALVAVAGYMMLRSRPGAKPTVPQANATFAELTFESGEKSFPSLSPDGKSLVYALSTPNGDELYLVRVGGRNRLDLTQGTQPAFSPDGELIAFRSEKDGGGIFLMGATGESIRRLIASGYNPSWSPDGKEIVCATDGVVLPFFRSSAKSQLWRVNASTGAKQAITPADQDAVQPSWSPHGDRIAFWASNDIWTVPAAGGERVAVTHGTSLDWDPVWSPDGTHLYFLSDRSGSMNVWQVAVNEKTGEVLGAPQPVTTPATEVAHLAFSHDGHRMAYVQRTSSNVLQGLRFDSASGEISGDPVMLARLPTGALGLDVSPNGQWITFPSGGQQENIFAIKSDGSETRQLTDGEYKDFMAHWSPDGKKILFGSNRSGNLQLWTINADGGGLEQLTHMPNGQIAAALWSPHGDYIVYSSRGAGLSMVDVNRAGDKEVRPVLPGASSEAALLLPWSWSPDGRKIAGFQLRADNTLGGVFEYLPESHQFKQLSENGKGPVWLKDSRRLLMADQGNVELMDTGTGKTRIILSLGKVRIDGLAVSPDDHTIYLVRTLTDSDVWMMTLQ